MGNFYTNFSIRSTDQAGIARLLQDAGRSAFVLPAQGDFVIVCESETDMQDDIAIVELGSALSDVTHVPVIGVLNHDDDVLCYWLFEGGVLTEQYNSDPDYFGEDEDGLSTEGLTSSGDRLCATLGHPEAHSTVAGVLTSDGYTFAIERHRDLIMAVGLPPASAGAGFNYIDNGEIPPELADQKGIIRVG